MCLFFFIIMWLCAIHYNSTLRSFIFMLLSVIIYNSARLLNSVICICTPPIDVTAWTVSGVGASSSGVLLASPVITLDSFTILSVTIS